MQKNKEDCVQTITAYPADENWLEANVCLESEGGESVPHETGTTVIHHFSGSGNFYSSFILRVLFFCFAMPHYFKGLSIFFARMFVHIQES